MANKKYKDSDILAAMNAHLNEDSAIYGANGHYSVGAYYDVLGGDYNKQANLDAASGTTAAEMFRTDDGNLDENLQNAVWMKEY